MKKKIYIEFILLILLIFFSSLSLPPFNYVIINFFTFSLFYILLVRLSLTSENKKILFIYGWLFGFGYFASNLYWISLSLTFDENFKFLIPLAVVLVPAFLALFYGLISYLFVTFRQKKTWALFSFFFNIWNNRILRGSILTDSYGTWLPIVFLII